MIEVILGIAVGIILGAVIGYFAGLRSKKQALQDITARFTNEMEVNESRYREEQTSLERHHKESIESLERHHKEEMEMMKIQGSENLATAKENSRLQIEALKEHYREQTELMNGRFEETISKMREEITNITKQMLEQREKEFAIHSEERIGKMMEPLERNINEMRQTVQINTRQHAEFSGQLKASVENVLRQSEAACQSADRLATALSGSNKTQGNWGETVLKELLENSGLKEDIHFKTQVFLEDKMGNKISGEDGSKLQPDVIVRLDKNHSVIIDSKVSLTDFFKYSEAEDEISRKEYLKSHIQSLKQQVRRLAAKDYSKYLPDSTGYVIMFVPVSQALYVATNEDHALWRDAMEQGVYLADEQTLYAALKIISLNWKQQAQAENHEQVFKLANEMIDRVGMFMEKYAEIGKALEKAQGSYDDGMKKLQDKGQSIPITCKKLIQLGARYDKRKGLLAQELES